MLKEIAKKYYEMGYNCAESILRAGNEYYQLGLNDHDMIMVAAFGGGMQVGDVCGCITGACCILSSKYVEAKAHDTKDLRKLTQRLVIAMQKSLGSRLCSEIKVNFYSKEKGCLKTVLASADVIQQVFSEWDNELEN